MAIIERKVVPDSIGYSDSWRGYNVLDVSDFHHFRFNHTELFSDARNLINGIENFLEPREASYAQVQWRSEGSIRSLFEGMRIAI